VDIGRCPVSLIIVAPVLVAVFAGACGGGGSSSSPHSPTAPTPTPTPTTTTVYAAYDKVVIMMSWNPAEGDNVALDGQWFSAGWWYFDGSTLHPPRPGRVSRGEMAAVKFTIPPQVSGRTITKATLRLYLTDSTYAVRRDLEIAPQILVNAFTQNWDPTTLSWNIWASLGTHTTGAAQASAPNSAESPLDFDVATIVRNWASGGWGNYGVKLSVAQYPDPGYDSSGVTTFQSMGHYQTPDQRPQLIIEYQ
jgi:hypothetical protein